MQGYGHNIAQQICVDCNITDGWFLQNSIAGAGSAALTAGVAISGELVPNKHRFALFAIVSVTLGPLIAIAPGLGMWINLHLACLVCLTRVYRSHLLCQHCTWLAVDIRSLCYTHVRRFRFDSLLLFPSGFPQLAQTRNKDRYHQIVRLCWYGALFRKLFGPTFGRLVGWSAIR